MSENLSNHSREYARLQGYRKRALAQDARATFLNCQTFGNAFRAWLSHLDADQTAPQDSRSAKRFVKTLRSFCATVSGEPDYPETSRMSAEVLVRWVDDLAWSLNAKHTLNENADQLRNPTARVASNFRSFILFLVQTGSHIIPQRDFTYLLNECNALEEDLARISRINRIMEEYAVYVQEAYFDTGRTVDETYYGEYEVERIDGRSAIVLRRYDPDDDSDTSSASLRSFATYFPTPLVRNVRRGDTLTLQICHLEAYRVWVPYMYSGCTPSRDEGGALTPVDRHGRAASGTVRGPVPLTMLQDSLQHLELSQTRRVSSPTREQGRSRTPRRRSPSYTENVSKTPPFVLDFDESKFTDEYFRAWDGDIDSDEDLSGFLESLGDDRRVTGIEGSHSTRPLATQQERSPQRMLRERHSYS